MTTTPNTTDSAAITVPPFPDAVPIWRRTRELDAGYVRDYCEIDAEVAARCTCTVCGHVGLGYRGWRRPEKTGPHFWISSSYRAFTVCPICTHSEEF